MRLEKQLYTQCKKLPESGFDETHYHETLELIKQDMEGKKRTVRRIDKRFLSGQLYRNSLPAGLIQMAMLILIVALSGFSQGLTDSASVLRHLPLMTGLFAVAAAMTGMFLLQRGRRCRAAEIEMAAYVSRNEVMIIHMIIFTVQNIVVAAVLYLMLRMRADISIRSYLVYTVLPYLLAGTGCLYIYRYVAEEYKDEISVIFAALLAALLFGADRFWPWIYQEVYLHVWAGISLAAVLLAGYCIRNELRKGGSIDGFNI